MASENIQDTRFQQILELEGIGLDQFFQQNANTDLFVDAQTYPVFFNDNLVSPNRVLKEFLNNPHSNIRIFYLQLFRLGYEIESQTNNNRDFIVNLRRIIFHPDFQILFTEETENQRNLYNDFQFKRLFAEFIVLLQRQEFPNVEQIITHYSIMDTIFIHIFRSLLASQNINEEFDGIISSQVVFGQLCNLLRLTITSYGNCWKFQDSDMFCYDDGQNQLYLAYIIEDQQASQSQEQIQQQQYPQRDQSSLYQNPNTQSHTNNINSNIITSHGYRNINYQNQKPIIANPVDNYQQQNKETLNYHVNDYFSNNNQVNKSENRAQFISSYKSPEATTSFKAYQKSYQPTNYNNNNNQIYSNYQSSRNYSYNNYNPVQIIPSTIYQPEPYLTTFKPVEPTPMPLFDKYQPYPQSRRDYKKPSTSYQTYNDYRPTQPSSSYSSSVFDSNNIYKPIPITTSGDYFGDFTPPDILSKLRSDNRNNINKIREAMKGISRGVEIPPGFDLKKSAIYTNSSSTPSFSKQDLYRTESHNQFQYYDSKPSNEYQYKPSSNYQESYSRYNKSYY